MKVYQNARSAEEKNAESLHLRIRYRNTGFKLFEYWENVNGQILNDYFYLNDNSIPVIQEMIGKCFLSVVFQQCLQQEFCHIFENNH